MINKFISQFSNIDKSILTTIKIVVKVSLIICAIASLILCIYISNPISNDTYLLGLMLFKAGLTYIATGIICGFFFDYIVYKKLI